MVQTAAPTGSIGHLHRFGLFSCVTSQVFQDKVSENLSESYLFVPPFLPSSNFASCTLESCIARALYICDGLYYNGVIVAMGLRAFS